MQRANKLLFPLSGSPQVEYRLFLNWLLCFGVFFFLFFVSWQEEVLQHMYLLDRSMICWLLSFLFLLCLGHAGLCSFCFSKEIKHAESLWKDLIDKRELTLLWQDGAYFKGKEKEPNTLTTRAVFDLLSDGASSSPGGDRQSILAKLSVYTQQMKNHTEFGWFLSDVMLKLGLLGTVVGFIMMLSGVHDLSTIDLGVIQKLLSQMSVGMSTALYTTLAGLIANLLTAFQYSLIERAITQWHDLHYGFCRAYMMRA